MRGAAIVQMARANVYRCEGRYLRMRWMGTGAVLVLAGASAMAQVSGVGEAGAAVQGAVVSALPDAPQVGQTAAPTQVEQTAASTQDLGEPRQTKRILGIVPNFRSVSAGVVLRPQTTKEKLSTGFSDSFDYSAVAFAGIQAGISQATDAYPAFHQGAAGYARYFWHQFADQADENLLVESLLPIALHEDSRYYTLGHGGFLKRSVYSASRVLLTRTDSGRESVNVSEILGAGGAAAISSAYYPGQYCTWTKTGQRWLTNVILDGAEFYVKEFWPDINRRFSKGGS